MKHPPYLKPLSLSSLPQAFTLIELIVVITIITILSTIGFISYSNYITTSRDSVRISQLTKISDALQIRLINHRLPIPSNSIEITSEGNLVSTQGLLSETVLQTIYYSEAARDPKDNSLYIYLVNGERDSFQLLSYMENPSSTSYASIGIQNKYPRTYCARLGIIL
ncbi:prepilin-type N-terminal cleavage/methylation domain-containing protein [Candidatus Gracilibacteria bacterium]|nr:prepilin-type N-terminal cleavage/methylation domain-containing protein [Candidatus Gracilibacteria bacterium]